MKKPKKIKKRKKHANLDPLYNPRVRREYIDYDYTKDLSKEDLDFLSQFTGEYYGASVEVRKNSSKIKAQRTVKSKHLHKDMLAKPLFDNNNKRNNDLLGVTKVNGLLSDIKDQSDSIGIADYGKSEEAMIALIDYKKTKT